MKHSAAAFTLMEVAVAMVISAIVALAAVMLHVSLTNSFTSVRRIAELSDRVLATSTYLARELTTVGGNTATASMSVTVENNCAARGEFPACPNGSDRVTMFAAVPRTPACRVSHVDNSVTPPRFAFWFRDINGQSRCCLNDELNGIRVPGDPPTQYLKRHLMLSNGPFHKPVLLIAEANAPGFTTAPAPASYDDRDIDDDGFIDTRCTFRAIEVVPASQRAEPPRVTDWVDASASIVDMRTMYLDATEVGAPPKLMLHTDKDENSGGASPSTTNAGTPGGPWGWSDPVNPREEERLMIVDGVYDFQLMLGYDLNDDDRVSASEWVHDVPGESRDLADDRRLRLLRFDLVMGIPLSGNQANNAEPTPARDGGATLQLPGVALRATSMTVQPRNGDALLAGVD